MAIERAPDAELEVTGEKVTVRLMLWPAVNIAGNLGPLKLKLDPVRVACEIIRLTLPVLVRERIRVLLEATATFPKLRLVELGVSRWVTPVPDKAILRGETEASLTIETYPEASPLVAGAKTTSKVILWLADMLMGR